MKSMSIKQAKDQLSALARDAEQGADIVVSRDGVPVFKLDPHIERGGLNIEAGRAFLLSKGVAGPACHISDDFDEPLPEDFLLKPVQKA